MVISTIYCQVIIKYEYLSIVWIWFFISPNSIVLIVLGTFKSASKLLLNRQKLATWSVDLYKSLFTAFEVIYLSIHPSIWFLRFEIYMILIILICISKPSDTPTTSCIRFDFFANFYQFFKFCVGNSSYLFISRSHKKKMPSKQENLRDKNTNLRDKN